MQTSSDYAIWRRITTSPHVTGQLDGPNGVKLERASPGDPYIRPPLSMGLRKIYLFSIYISATRMKFKSRLDHSSDLVHEACMQNSTPFRPSSYPRGLGRVWDWAPHPAIEGCQYVRLNFIIPTLEDSSFSSNHYQFHPNHPFILIYVSAFFE